MKMSEHFEGESQFLKAADLQGHEVRVTIEKVDFAEMDQDGRTVMKPFVSFKGKEKGMVLNKTNGHRLIDAFGDYSEGWIGKEIYLFSETVEFRGQPTQGLRLRVPKPLVSDDDSVPF